MGGAQGATQAPRDIANRREPPPRVEGRAQLTGVVIFSYRFIHQIVWAHVIRHGGFNLGRYRYRFVSDAIARCSGRGAVSSPSTVQCEIQAGARPPARRGVGIFLFRYLEIRGDLYSGGKMVFPSGPITLGTGDSASRSFFVRCFTRILT